jgi:NTE family protein
VLLARHVDTPLDVDALERDMAIVAGLDRYESVTWRLTRNAARDAGLVVRGRIKSYGPPFLMLGGLLENTTSNDFRIAATARYLAFDQVGSGSELRVDATIGSDPSAAIELYRPIGPTPLFLAPYAGVITTTFDVIDQDAVIARYGETIPRLGLNLGINIGAHSDLRAGAYVAHRASSIETGDPGFPEVRGKETGAELVWRVNTQDSPVVPAAGVYSQVRVSHIFTGPGITGDVPVRFDTSPTQLSGTANRFWSIGLRNRVFAYGALGTSFTSTPLPPEQFALGVPFKLSAYDTNEIGGPHFYAVTGGYLRQIGRLPDFVGGPVFVGTWLENGDAFTSWGKATWRSNGGAGFVMDTLVGPLVMAGSWSFDGRWRTYLAAGRTFR